VVVATRRSIRASDADREQAVDRLRKAAAEGRIAAHELEHRVAVALKARTYGDLDATTSDLPSIERRPGRRIAGGTAVATVRAHPALLLLAIPVALVVVAVMVAITVLFTVFALLMFVLGHRRGYGYRGPWMYLGRGRGWVYTARGRTLPRRSSGGPRSFRA
jgi:hypothetical protein